MCLNLYEGTKMKREAENPESCLPASSFLSPLLYLSFQAAFTFKYKGEADLQHGIVILYHLF